MTRLSYRKIGHAIVKFTNHYVEQWDRVDLIPPLGQKREKATLAMPPHMVKALTADVAMRARTFEPAGKYSEDPEAPCKLAKYLGKY